MVVGFAAILMIFAPFGAILLHFWHLWEPGGIQWQPGEAKRGTLGENVRFYESFGDPFGSLFGSCGSLVDRFVEVFMKLICRLVFWTRFNAKINVSESGQCVFSF